jgi:hypothetical protein
MPLLVVHKPPLLQGLGVHAFVVVVIIMVVLVLDLNSFEGCPNEFIVVLIILLVTVDS